jgi:hypothetical protein
MTAAKKKKKKKKKAGYLPEPTNTNVVCNAESLTPKYLLGSVFWIS